jgi:hypothetical protein
LRIQTISLVLATSVLLSGCASFSLFGSRVKPVEIQTKAVERTRLDLPIPTPLSPKPVEWFLITPQNAEEVWAKLKEKNADIVLFGLTDDGYEELAMTMAELRNYIAAQRQIIIKYKEYYEPSKDEEKKDAGTGK